MEAKLEKGIRIEEGFRVVFFHFTASADKEVKKLQYPCVCCFSVVCPLGVTIFWEGWRLLVKEVML